MHAEATTLRAVATEMVVKHQSRLLRTARRYSLCATDAEDAYQRGMEILMTKAPEGFGQQSPTQRLRWCQTVVKHEAISIRRKRLRSLDGNPQEEDSSEPIWTDLLVCERPGPDEHVERREDIAVFSEALSTVKPQELRALTMFAEGYTYDEIAELNGWTWTKVNRCLAEGRQRLRSFMARRAQGGVHRAPPKQAPKPRPAVKPKTSSKRKQTKERNTMKDLMGLLDQAIKESEAKVAQHQDDLDRAIAAKQTLEGRGGPGRKPTLAEPKPKRQVRRRRRRGNRSEQALALVTAKPGITVAEIAKEMKIKPNYLYRLMGELVDEKKVEKQGRAYSAL